MLSCRLTVLGCLSLLPSLLAAQAAAPPPACRAIRGIESLLKPGAVVMLGEMHGTNESPAFLSDTVCHAIRAGLQVTVGLEVPREEDGRVAAFVESAGTAADRTALLAGPFWQDAYQDGRRSEAMAQLIEQLRRLRKDGGKVRVLLLDIAKFSSNQERDQAMAARLREAIGASPTDLFLTLTGNVHNRTVRGTPWVANYEPFGYLLTQGSGPAGTRLISLDVSHTGGAAWICTNDKAEDCHSRPLRGEGQGQDLAVVLGEAADANGYHGRYNVGTLTASPPAVARPTSGAAAGTPPSAAKPPGSP
jgi:hypothetical protein